MSSEHDPDMFSEDDVARAVQYCRSKGWGADMTAFAIPQRWHELGQAPGLDDLNIFQVGEDGDKNDDLKWGLTRELNTGSGYGTCRLLYLVLCKMQQVFIYTHTNLSLNGI